jgi:phenylpropionate dioxygenase-like ring-hydroxylating dioxygenase large terminal subunit
MLSTQENDLLTRVGPGTPMGELYRRFWLPVLLTDELPEPDCTPVRLPVLGERLVAFRDTQGRVGVLDERCPHRLASLFWGRNEEGGLRCVYHGWKWDIEGRCLDLPNTQEGDTYKDKVTTYAAYPAVERGGLVWTYMGPKDNQPPVPGFEMNTVPDSHRYISKMFIKGNWLQGLEGDIDSSHVSFLHSRIDAVRGDLAAMNRTSMAVFDDKAPRWEIRDTDYGVALAAQRNGPDGTNNWRVNQWTMPSFTMIAAKPGTYIHFQVRVPMDDESQIYYRIIWHPERPLTEQEVRDARTSGVNFPEVVPGTFMPAERAENNYLIDREAQRTRSFTGIKSIPAQDWAVQSDQGGPICDRSLEHLVSADSAIISMRQRLLKALQQVEAGAEPSEPSSAGRTHYRPVDIMLPVGESIWETGSKYLEGREWSPVPESPIPAG